MTQLKFLLMSVCILGPQATQAALCDPGPCKNGGRCVHLDESYGYYCTCVGTGYFGVLCEFSNNYLTAELCHANPCKNDAVCVVHDDNHGYNCKCQPGYYGPLCEFSKLCDPTPCKNGATCQLDDTAKSGLGYNCTCKPGYIGLNCEWDGPKCTADTTTPCYNNAPCVSSRGRSCICRRNKGGHYCELESPCKTCPKKTAKCSLYKYSQWGRRCLDANGVQLS